MKYGCYTGDPCNSSYPMVQEEYVSEKPVFVALLVKLSMRAHSFSFHTRQVLKTTNHSKEIKSTKNLTNRCHAVAPLVVISIVRGSDSVSTDLCAVPSS